MIRRRIVNTEKIKLIVLDEADEMLSSGFKDQMYKIFQFMPNEIQIGLFSATLPKELLELTNTFMKYPTKILVKNDELFSKVLHNIILIFMEMNKNLYVLKIYFHL